MNVTRVSGPGARPGWRRDRRCAALLCLALLGAALGAQAADPAGTRHCAKPLVQLLPTTPAASIRRGDVLLQADRISYRQGEDLFIAEGNVLLRDDDSLDILGNSARLNLSTRDGEITGARFYRPADGSQGRAARLRLQGGTRIELVETNFTSCDPEDPDWELVAGNILLDNATHQGHAEDVVLRFKGVPLLYLPYMRFPIGDARLTGFLFPSLGTTVETGTELRVPYYWNIAPNMDATFTPRWMSKRGTMLETEFRYLTPRHGGKLFLTWLPEDDLSGEERGELRWTHSASLARGWSAGIDFATVSDDNYLEDFGGNLASTSITHLEQLAQLVYTSREWTVTTRLQGYKTLSGAIPYRRLPQISFARRTLERPNRFNFLFSGELVRFDHPTDVPVGQRVDLQPGISYPLYTPGAWLTPKLVLRHTAYQLERVGPGQPDAPTRSLPVVSIDSGLVFERNFDWGQRALVQTLEPRVKYLYIPERDQSQLPNFDTTELTPTLFQLFRDYSFTGADRVAAANRITAALNSRILDPRNGRELLVAGIGQAFEFNPRPGEPSTSNLFAELHGQPTLDWDLGLRVEWNPRTDEAETITTRLRYRDAHNNAFFLRYRFLRDEVKNWEVGGLWRINARWQLIGLRQYDLINDRDTETIYGFQYDSCCWGLRLVRREYIADELGGSNNAILLELNLKGLSSFGDQKRIGRLLERGILP